MNQLTHQRIAAIALPMLIANISQPLLGLVDSYIVGHMPQAAYLAGVALGAMLITQLYWISGALRMSATGLSAQAKGASNSSLSHQHWWQLVVISVLVALFIMATLPLLGDAVLAYSEPGVLAAAAMSDYLSMRLFGAPAALLNLVLIGWLIGQQRATLVMWVQVIGNVLNALLSLFFVYELGMGVRGVALATTCVEWGMCLVALGALSHHWRGVRPSWQLFTYQRLRQVLSMNSAMLVRNLALQACLAFITLQGARYGVQVVAVNSLLMQFMGLTALGLDAVAYAAEALVGEAKGQRNAQRIRAWVRMTLIWSVVAAVLYSLIFLLGGHTIIAWLTDIQALRRLAADYVIYPAILPLLAHWCFLFDGVYVGLGWSKVMRNSMLISASTGFFGVYALLQAQGGNHALWLALLCFFVVRGFTLMVHFYRCEDTRLAA